MEVESGRLCNQLEHGRLTQKSAPPRFVRTAYNDMSNSMGAGKFKQRLDRFVRPQAHHFGAEIARPLFVFQKMTLQGRIDSMIGFMLRLDVHGKPISVQSSCKTRALSK